MRLVVEWDGAGLEFDEFVFGDAAGAEDSDLGKGAADHGDFVAGVEAGAGLAVLVDLVGQGSAVDYAEAEVEEEVGDAGEEADGGDLLLFGFFEEGAEETAAGALAFRFGLDDDGANLGEVGTVEVEGSAAEEDTACFSRDGGFGYSEVADVFADLGVAAAEEGAVAGEGVDEVEDVDSVGELRFANHCSAFAQARGGCRFTCGQQRRCGQRRYAPSLYSYITFDA
jgi:hypothetical protein